MADGDAHARQGVVGILGDAGIADIGEHEMVAGGEVFVEQRRDGGHARGEAHRRFTAFELGEALFEQFEGGVAPAGVKMRRVVLEV